MKKEADCHLAINLLSAKFNCFAIHINPIIPLIIIGKANKIAYSSFAAITAVVTRYATKNTQPYLPIKADSFLISNNATDAPIEKYSSP